MDVLKRKGVTVEKSVFNKLEILSDEVEEQKRATHEQFLEAYGEDTISAGMSSQVQEAQTNILAQTFGQERPSDDAIDDMVEKTHRDFTGSGVSILTRSKRRKGTREKMALQKHLIAERQALIEQRKTEKDMAESFTNKETAEKMGQQSDEMKASVREWLVHESDELGRKDAKYAEYEGDFFNGENERARRTSCSYVIHVCEKIDLNEFIDGSDGEFASNFASKYQKLCKVATAGPFVEEYVKLGGGLEKIDINDVRAKVEFCKLMKTQYERRLQLISSPYYALLRKTDMDIYMGDDYQERLDKLTDQKFKDYVHLFREVQGSKLAMGKRDEAWEVFEIEKQKIIKKDSEHSQKVTAKFLTDVDKIYRNNKNIYNPDPKELEGLTDEKKRLHELFHLKKADSVKNYPSNNLEFAKKVELTAADLTSSDGHTTEDLKRLENVLIDQVMEKKSMGGKAINDKDWPDIEAALNEMMNVRRQLCASVEAFDMASYAGSGLGLELKNEEFLKSSAGKQLLKYNGNANFMLSDVTKLRREFVRKMTDVYAVLHSKGFVIDKKREDKIIDGADEAVEEFRKEMERKQNRGKKEEEKKRYDFQEVIINGKKFKTYDYKLGGFENKQFNIEGPEGAEAERLMAEVENLKRLQRGVDIMYNGGGGEKSIIRAVYMEEYQKKTDQLLSKLSEILNKNGNK